MEPTIIVTVWRLPSDLSVVFCSLEQKRRRSGSEFTFLSRTTPIAACAVKTNAFKSNITPTARLTLNAARPTIHPLRKRNTRQKQKKISRWNVCERQKEQGFNELYWGHLKPQPGMPIVMRTYTTTWTKKMKKNRKKLKELSLLLTEKQIQQEGSSESVLFH